MPKIFTIKFTKPFLAEEYEKRLKSIGMIAKENGVNPSIIRRHLIYFNIPIRTQSQAQSLADSTGRRTNPTRGRKRSEAEKHSIAHAVSSEYWQRSEVEREAHAQRSRDRYKAMSDEKREEMLKASNDGVRAAAKVGSKFETYLFEELRRAGHFVEKHKTATIQNLEMHFDLFLPQRNLVIEVDGPTHLRPVYGKTEQDFKNKLEKDNRKNSLIVQNNMRIIRLGVEKADSIPKKERYLKELLDSINTLDANQDMVIYIGDYKSR